MAIALYDFSGKSGQILFRKEDLFLVKQSSGKWLHAEKGEENDWVPQNYILIFDKILSEKQAKKDYHIEGNNSLSFSKGDLRGTTDPEIGWVIN